VADRQLLSRFTVLSSSHAEFVRDALCQLYFDLTFAPRKPYTLFDAQLNAVSLPSGLTLSSVMFGTGIEATSPALPRVYDLSIFLDGVGQVKADRTVCEMSCTSGAIMSPDRPTHLLSKAATTGLGINIPADLVEGHIVALTGQELHEPVDFEPSMQLDGPVGAAWRFAHHVASEIDRDESLLSNLLLTQQFSETLLNLLLMTQPHNYSLLLRSQAKSAGPYYVRSAEEYIEAHCHEPITARQLADVAGVSVSALYESFGRHRNSTPIKFLKKVRLRRARDQLLAAAPGCSVTRVAAKWGFLNLGRFAADYRQQYSENPSDTLRKARG
jgi:AraC-like DNA-binding protein